MSSILIPNAGNDKGKTSDGFTSSLPHANNASPSDQDNFYCTLLTATRVLVVNMKHIKNELK